MTDQSDWFEKLKAILREKLPDAEVQVLMTKLAIAPENSSVAIGGSATESVIQTGSHNQVNNVYQGWSIGDIQEILKILQQAETASLSSTSSLMEDVHLEKVTLDFQTITFVNSRLEALRELLKSKQLSEDQLDKLALLKRKITAANELDQELKEIETIAGSIIEQSIFTLASKIQDLRRESDQEILEIHEGINLEYREVCLREQLQLVKKLETDLSFGKQGAAWLNLNISEFARIIGKYALSQCPDLQQATSKDEIDDFYFSIEQFLERVGHCLIWGRYSILDSFDIVLIFNPTLYETAFSFFKETVMPAHLHTEVKKQLEDYINYLISRLPLYPR